jgi:hypothetical protein
MEHISASDKSPIHSRRSVDKCIGLLSLIERKYDLSDLPTHRPSGASVEEAVYDAFFTAGGVHVPSKMVSLGQ